MKKSQGGQAGCHDHIPCPCGAPRDFRVEGRKGLCFLCRRCWLDKAIARSAAARAKRREAREARKAAAPPPVERVSPKVPIPRGHNPFENDYWPLLPGNSKEKPTPVAELSWMAGGRMVRSCRCGAVVPVGEPCGKCETAA